jgi:sulfoxide reductase heme-binding subunit YedZ
MAARGALAPRVKPTVFALCLLPLLWAVGQALTGGLGTNPIEEITHRSGDWTLRLLLITLCVSPLRWLTGWNALLRLRRMLGLFAFFYAALHLTTYLWLDQFFLWGEIVADIIKRPFITVGMASFLILLALALTSTQGAVRRLGRRWITLHRGVYVAAILGVVHFWWLVKFDVREPALYAVLLTILLVARAMRAGWRRWGPRLEPAVATGQ